MAFSQYGTGQRLAFAALGIGFILCVVGAASPYWMFSEVDASDATLGLAGNIPLIGDIVNNVLDDYNLITINLGVWMYCVDYFERTTECHALYTGHESTDLSLDLDDEDEDESIAWIQFVRGAVIFNLALGLATALAACCRCCCSSGGKTTCDGIFSFIAGGCGVAGFAIMLSRREDLLPNLPIFEIELDWGFYLYAAGSGLMVVASILLCVSVPDQTHSGVVMPMPVTMPTVQVANTSYQTPQLAMPHPGPPQTPLPATSLYPDKY